MDEQYSERMRLRTIRVTLNAALRSASTPEVEEAALGRAQALLDLVDGQLTDPGLRAELDGLRSKVAARLNGERRNGESSG